MKRLVTPKYKQGKTLKTAMFDNFVLSDADESRDARNALNSSRQKVVEENRNRLSHIIGTIEFCGRQEIPLRGHIDAGAFSLNETDCNDGVFKAALRLRWRLLTSKHLTSF